MQKILVSGSLAYDYLYTFPGNFRDNFATGAANLNVAFNVSEKTVNFGGCAGNIVFNARLINEDFVLLGIAGHDFGEYKKWLNKNKINTDDVIIDSSQYTSQAVVATDEKHQQIIIFYEGAAKMSDRYADRISATVKKHASAGCCLAIISPNNKSFMMETISACKEADIAYFFDPGQAMPLFLGEELLKVCESAYGLFLNESELALLAERLKMQSSKVVEICPLTVVTLGKKGAKIYFEGKGIVIPTQKVATPVDPTGCGDAFRAGFLSVVQNHFPKLSEEILVKAGDLGTELALKCIMKVGTQNHYSI